MDLQEDFFGEDRPAGDAGRSAWRADGGYRRRRDGRRARRLRPARSNRTTSRSSSPDTGRGGRMKALVVALVLLLPIRAAAQDAAAERIDAYVRDEMARQQIPGIAAAVIRDGHDRARQRLRPRERRASGAGEARNGLPVGIGRQAVHGDSGDAPRRAGQRVARRSDHEVPSRRRSRAGRQSRFATCSRIPAAPPTIRRTSIFAATTPRLRWSSARPPFRSRSRRARNGQYSNIGYLLLGVLIHRVTGEFYGDFLREKIFEPLGHDDGTHHQRSRHRARTARPAIGWSRAS